MICQKKSSRREGLALSGTLGVLQQAHARRMIEIAPVMEALLSSTNFYISAALTGRIITEAENM
jgi:predicted nucleic acid-binding protein